MPDLIAAILMTAGCYLAARSGGDLAWRRASFVSFGVAGFVAVGARTPMVGPHALPLASALFLMASGVIAATSAALFLFGETDRESSLGMAGTTVVATGLAIWQQQTWVAALALAVGVTCAALRWFADRSHDPNSRDNPPHEPLLTAFAAGLMCLALLASSNAMTVPHADASQAAVPPEVSGHESSADARPFPRHLLTAVLGATLLASVLLSLRRSPTEDDAPTDHFTSDEPTNGESSARAPGASSKESA